MAAILVREIGESEFLGAAALPQEIGVHVARHRLRPREQLDCARLRESQQDVFGPDFCALSVRRFNLDGIVTFGENRGDFERAAVFVKNVHTRGPCREGPRRAGPMMR